MLHEGLHLDQILQLTRRPSYKINRKVYLDSTRVTYRSDSGPYTAAPGCRAWCPVCGSAVCRWACTVSTMIHPRRSKGLWPGSIQHRPSHKSHSDAASPVLHLLESPHTGLAVGNNEGRKQGVRHDEDYSPQCIYRNKPLKIVIKIISTHPFHRNVHWCNWSWHLQ